MAVLVTPIFLHAVLPQPIDSLFSFAHSAHAQTDGEDGILHDSNINLLEAATNPDPNPNKSGEHQMEVADGSALVPHADMVNTATGVVAGVSTSNPKKGEISIYTVKEGDSLSEIAEMHGVSMNTVLWANDIRDASTIRIGDELIILPVSGVRHTVKSGDNLSSIAKKYGSNADDIALYNGMEVSDTIAIGEEVIIPDGAFPSSSGSKSVAKSSPKSGGSSAKSASSANGKFSNPLPGAPITQANHGYNAVDLDGETGDPIYASADGTVLIAKGSGWNGGYGTYVVLEHGGGTQTLYAHMSKIAVSSGPVDKGDVIGYVGNTGKSTGSHLHFEVRGATNPL